MKALFLMVCFLGLASVGGGNAHEFSRHAPLIATKKWGEAFDPDGDCKFVIEMGRLAIGVPGTDHSLGYERGKMNAPRVLRAVEGDFIAQVKISGAFPTGATSMIPSRRSFHGAGLLVWLDEKNYLRLERAEMVHENMNLSYASFESRINGEFICKGNASEMALTGGTTHLRLERRDDIVYASTSEDGIHWSSVDPIEVQLPKKLFVGVAAGHNTSSPFEAVFEELKIYTELDD
jgi:regulation of enolase protein 1 (concanavalin A-like superfamily)